MVLDLITIAFILLDLKCIFSVMGLLFTSNCTCLQSDIIGALMAMGLWDKKGVINIINGRLS